MMARERCTFSGIFRAGRRSGSWEPVSPPWRFPSSDYWPTSSLRSLPVARSSPRAHRGPVLGQYNASSLRCSGEHRKCHDACRVRHSLACRLSSRSGARCKQKLFTPGRGRCRHLACECPRAVLRRELAAGRWWNNRPEHEWGELPSRLSDHRRRPWHLSEGDSGSGELPDYLARLVLRSSDPHPRPRAEAFWKRSDHRRIHDADLFLRCGQQPGFEWRSPVQHPLARRDPRRTRATPYFKPPNSRQTWSPCVAPSRAASEPPSPFVSMLQRRP